MFRNMAITTILLFCIVPLQGQTADELITKYIKAIGGMENIEAVTTLVRTGKYDGGGGFEANIRNENKRPNLVREEFSLQGLTGVNAYDGKTGWKVAPWSGKKDAEAMSEDEIRGIIEDSDFDGPLIHYKEKGNVVIFLGMEPVEGTDALKLQVTVPNGDMYYYYMDTDYYVPIKIDTKRMIRGEEQEFETSLGDYKKVNGWYLPFSTETNAKGSEYKSKFTYDTIEANATIDDQRFAKPSAAGSQHKDK